MTEQEINNKDFIVYLHERYGMTKEELFKEMSPITVKCIDDADCEDIRKIIDKINNSSYSYEESSGIDKMPNVDYDRLFIGARLYLDSSSLVEGSNYKEIEVTLLYGGVMFYKWLNGEHAGEEDYLSKKCFAFSRCLYPKIVVKPKFVKMVCDCNKVVFKDYLEE